MKLINLCPLLLTSCLMVSACDKVNDDNHVPANTPDQKKEVVKVQPAPPKVTYKPLVYADQSLEEVFIRNDLKALINKADALELGKKKEFEKTEAFSARKADFVSLVNKFEGKSSLIFFVPDEQSITYDADAEEFKVNLISHSNFDGLISYNTSKKFPFALSVANESVNGEKMYGLPVYERINYRVGFNSNKKSYGDISLSLPVSIDKAQSLKNSVSIAVVGSVVDPIVMSWGSMEIRSDNVEKYTDRTLLLSGVQFWIYDKSTLAVKAKFDSNLKLIKQKIKI
ncbi:hypothetical protein [Pseudomonas mandelii]|uniref:hypothetical protein n=1 Tax=Pseudomonas mandelii TaxID=75612 RepID=UPI00224AE532|nr:hypothetical protein [Pseudomonas mandelii]MCX2901531.1 hypothetical protein [Pseudomonas mandelii]